MQRSSDTPHSGRETGKLLQLRNSATRFGVVAQLFHWAIVALIVYQYLLAERAEDAPLFQRLVILSRHKAFGITILILATLRLTWRLLNPPVEAPAGQPRYQQILAKASHDALYVLLFALPITGWLISSADNVPVSYFGLFALPDLIAPHESWVKPLQATHAALFNVLLAIVLIHASAAIYHEIIAKDNVLRRMIPGLDGGRQ
jgi:cytochrome b561